MTARTYAQVKGAAPEVWTEPQPNVVEERLRTVVTFETWEQRQQRQAEENIMKKYGIRILAMALLCVTIAGCDKYSAGSGVSRLIGNWVEVKLPEGCKARQIAADEHGGVSVLCEDGRVFH